MDSREEYEAEQQKLRQQHGYGDEEDDDFSSIDSFEIPEVNPEIYKDVDPILFQGFLTLSAEINKIPFVFKSLNHHEFLRLGMMHNVRGGPQDLHNYYSSFLAYGVVFADGLNVLENRGGHVSDLKDFFAEMDPHSKQDVVRYLSEVNRRANKAIMLVEAFSMENISRLRWAQMRGLDVSSPTVTGIMGTEGLGLNWGQLLWRALNHFEDQRENAEREWENAKFVASSMAGKGMQKVYSADKRRRQSEKEERHAHREKIIRHAIYGTPLDDGETHGPVQVARTVSELSEQIKHDLKGEQDWHDKVISDHENRIKKGYEERLDKVRALREDHIEKYGDRAVVSLPSESGLTQKDVEKRIQRRRQQHIEALAKRSQHPELFDPKYAEFADKWMNQQPIVQQPPSVMSPPDPSRPRSKPFNGGKK